MSQYFEYETPLFAADFKNAYQDVQDHIKDIPASYPRDYQRVDEKSAHVIGSLEFFAGMTVLDLGSNTGMYSLLAARHCRKVIGLEKSDLSVNISRQIHELFTKMNYFVSNVSFVCGTVKDLPTLEFDAVLACLVLYHLKDEEIDQLQNILRAKVRRMIVQTRPGRGELAYSGTLPDIATYNNRYHGMYSTAQVMSFLYDSGFTRLEVKTPARLYDGEIFPVITAEK
jgi:SAM-dependent methyltransferase